LANLNAARHAQQKYPPSTTTMAFQLHSFNYYLNFSRLCYYMLVGGFALLATHSKNILQARLQWHSNCIPLFITLISLGCATCWWMGLRCSPRTAKISSKHDYDGIPTTFLCLLL
jgi:hypothetical protein